MPHVTLLVSSANASSVSPDKSEIVYRLKPALNIPKDAKNASIQVNKSQIWWNTPNVDATNNVLQFVMGGSTQTWTADHGLYSLGDINTSLAYFLHSINMPEDAIQFVGLGYTGKLLVHVKATVATGDITMLWNSSTMDTLLGFNTNANFTVIVADDEESQVANLKAVFNTMLYWCVECHGLGVGEHMFAENGAQAEIIHTAAPVVSPGQQNIYEPVHPLKCPITTIGHQIPQISFVLTDQNHQRVSTQGEDWSFTAVISWDE